MSSMRCNYESFEPLITVFRKRSFEDRYPFKLSCFKPHTALTCTFTAEARTRGARSEERGDEEAGWDHRSENLDGLEIYADSSMCLCVGSALQQ